MSAGVSQAAITRGRLSIIALNSARCSSYLASVGPIHSIRLRLLLLGPRLSHSPPGERYLAMHPAYGCLTSRCFVSTE